MAAVVCDASPLITLAKAGLLDLLPRLFEPIWLPAGVEAEIARGSADDPMRTALSGAGWLWRIRLDPPLTPLAGWHLGLGEAEVIEYARLHPECGVILDDRAARRAALSLGLTVYGTLSVLALGRKRGWIPSFRRAAHAVMRVGPYVHPAVTTAIAKELGE